MKKTLIALAAVAATSAAFAQSTVTIYGVADVAVGRTTMVEKNDKGEVVSREKTTGAHANGLINNGNSRIGFKGSEDLGNGLKANFQFEQGVNLANGEASGFQRQAWVGLSGGFGALKAGRTTNAVDEAVSAWKIVDANYEVISKQFKSAGQSSRNDAIIKYYSPDFGGFKFVADYVFKDNRGGEKAKYDLALVYENGPLAAAASYSDFSIVRGEKLRSATVGAAYDFGGFKIGSSYHDIRVKEKDDKTQKRRGFSLGVSVPIGDAFSIAADAAHVRVKDGGEKVARGTDWVVEGKYALSKRTFVYAAYLRSRERPHADYGTTPSPSGSNYIVTGKNNYGIGIRHNF